MNNFYSNNGIGLGTSTWIHGHGLVLLLVILWSLFWKGLALWHSGRRGQPWWFVILLIVNTFGILEIIYLFAVLKLKPSKLFSK
jgi:hypothetical protein